MVKSFVIKLIAGFSLFFISSVNAQEMDVGILGGGTYYLGELNPGKQFLFTRPAFGGLLRINLDNRWAARLNILRGAMAGDDRVSKVNETRNLRFKSSITEISVIGEFNFLEYFTGSKINYFSPYLLVGPGYFIFNPKAPWDGNYYELNDIGTEGTDNNYKLYGFTAIFGFGFKYSLTNRIGISLEWGMRKTFTDYLDDISTEYYIDFDNVGNITYEELLSDLSEQKHDPGMQRGNPQNNDWYSFAGFSLTYRFKLGEKTTCREFEKSNN